MSNSFSKEEKRKYIFKKHIKDHLFEYVLDFIGPILFTMIILSLCKTEEFVYGIVFYSIGKTIYSIYHYKKEYVDIDIK